MTTTLETVIEESTFHNLIAKWDGVCHLCHKRISVGDKIKWCHDSRKIYCIRRCRINTKYSID